MERNTLYYGDCLEWMQDWVKTSRDSVDLVYLDPPFNSIMIMSFSKEKLGYDTQKPLALLKRIIKASSAEGEVVLDPFCACRSGAKGRENPARQ